MDTRKAHDASNYRSSNCTSKFGSRGGQEPKVEKGADGRTP